MLFCQARQKTRAKVGPFLDESGVPNPDPDYAARVLSEQYGSVFTVTRPENVVEDFKEHFKVSQSDLSQGMPLLSDINFSKQDIEQACKELKSASSPGPDGVPAVLLKTAAKELSEPIAVMWRASLNQGIIPPDLLLVLISPIHKGGSRRSAANYRPVALTSHLIKVFERVVRRHLVSHLESNNLLPDSQHGFRSRRSCLTQLLTFWDKVLDLLEEGKTVDAVYTDFAKAFDKCETGVLLRKLKECRIRGKVGCWLGAFLDPRIRKQSVGVQGRVSELIHVLSGIPQGTVLGPILSLVHLIGISECLSPGTSASSFADDTRVVRGISNAEDRECLQNDLNRVYEWAESVGMTFNSKKFELVRFSPNSVDEFDSSYAAPNGDSIEVKTCVRDLGVKVNSDLSFRDQIDSVFESANRMTGWALRSFKSRSKVVMLTILRSLIQPRMDYCSQLCSPSDQTSINRLEGIQRRFVAQIRDPSLVSLNYWDKLNCLGVYSQERRHHFFKKHHFFY